MPTKKRPSPEEIDRKTAKRLTELCRIIEKARVDYLKTTDKARNEIFKIQGACKHLKTSQMSDSDSAECLVCGRII